MSASFSFHQIFVVQVVDDGASDAVAEDVHGGPDSVEKPVHRPEDSNCLGWDSDCVEDHDQGDETRTWYGGGADARHGGGYAGIERVKRTVKKCREAAAGAAE